MAGSPQRRVRYDWLLITVLAAGMAMFAGWRHGYRSAQNDMIEPVAPTAETRAQRVADLEARRQQIAESLPPAPEGHVALGTFFELSSRDPDVFADALRRVKDGWRPAYFPLLIETARFGRGEPRLVLMQAVGELAGQDFGSGFDAAWRWVWSQDFEPHPQYGLFKAMLYAQIAPRFATYFDDHTQDATIRLDEVRWGGVRRDGIPPLDRPAMISADSPEADYLEDHNVVFGIELNGDARAYPKRILAWHEMFKDTFGPADDPLSISGVYCTLSGSMIVYHAVHEGVHHELGTSGFLYRSNILMYDHATESMWSTITGEPVIGPLVGRGIKLEPLHVVTTTWGEWKKRHPDTTVLSLDTGHSRDYGEGVAYQRYFATDELIFTVPQIDTRLKNKAEVLALRFGGDAAAPTVIDAAFLSRTPIYQGELGDVAYVVLTDPSGANRVYRTQGQRFTETRGDQSVVGDDGRVWRIDEDGLTADDGQTLARLPAHRAFWFGWHAAHPDTVLIR